MAATWGVVANAELCESVLEHVAPLGPSANGLVEAAVRGGRLSARGLRRDAWPAPSPTSRGTRRAFTDEHVGLALRLRAAASGVLGG